MGIWDFAGGIVSGIGSYFGAKENAKSAEKVNRQQLEYADSVNKNKIQWTVADAKAAGIHPLAALGSSAAGGFATPVLSAPSSGDAISAGANAVGKAISSLNVEQGNLQNDLLRSQIRKTDAEAESLLSSARSRTSLAMARSAAVGGPYGGLDASFIEAKPPEKPRRAIITLPGGIPHVTSESTEQQNVEDAYGGIVGEIYGIGRALYDGYQNYSVKPRRELMRRYNELGEVPPDYRDLWMPKN